MYGTNINFEVHFEAFIKTTKAGESIEVNVEDLPQEHPDLVDLDQVHSADIYFKIVRQISVGDDYSGTFEYLNYNIVWSGSYEFV